MKTINKTKETIRSEGGFDTVKMMCEIRNKIGSETQDMTFEELKDYIQSQLKKSKFKPLGK